ncbi:SET domain-containing protein 4-like isoform X1 [Asterias amurensis]|uniref:SET domain-containing protein 4-like isoform X1 n=2 Tax=Asterias amurensis TaxID=7602 RepID=UPI003AB6F4D1
MGRTLRNRRRRQRGNHPLHDDSAQTAMYIQLMKWMACNAFTGTQLQPAHFQDTGRGLKTTVDVKSGDTLLYIPSRLLITTSTVLRSQLGPFIQKHSPPMTSQQALAIFLLYEATKGRDSMWFPYIAIIPPSYTTPAFFNQEELQLLPKNLLTLATAQITKVRTAFKELESCFVEMKKLRPEMNVSYERFRWAWFTVNTRCVYGKQKKLCFAEEDNCVLAPFLDLLNHSPTAEIQAGYDASQEGYVITTDTPYKKWEQAFICYGPHSNQTLLLEYGFIVCNNQHSSLQFHIDDIIQCMDCRVTRHCNELQDRKLEIIRENNFQDNLCCGWDGLSWRLITALQIMCMDQVEINDWKRVYTTDSISPHCDNQVICLATRLLSREMQENQLVLRGIQDKMALQITSTDHISLIHGLRLERQHLLQIALKQLSS